MKKQYINPEMEIVELNAHQTLLAGSIKTFEVNDDEVELPADIL